MRLRKNAARGSNASDIGLLVRQLLQRQHKDSQGQQNEIKNPEKTSVSRNLLLVFCLTLKQSNPSIYLQTSSKQTNGHKQTHLHKHAVRQ